MTNSQATVMRPRRLNPRVFLILGLGAVALSVSVAMLGNKIQLPISLPFQGQGNTESPKAATGPVDTVRATPYPVDQAGYLKALDDASRQLSDKIQKNPADPALQNRLGLIYMNLGDTAGARECFTTAVELCRSALSGCSARIEKARTLGRNQEATKEVMTASGLSVELAAAHSNLARVYDQMGDRQKVIEELELLNRDGQLFHGASLAQGSLKVKDGRLSPIEARILAEAESNFHAGRSAQAVAEYRKLISMNPKLSLPHERLGLIAVSAGDTAGAIDEFELAAKIDPGSAIVQNNLGMAFGEMGMSKEAEQAYKKAVALDPSLEAASVNLGNLLSSQGRSGDALSIMRQAARTNPKSAHAQNNLATFLALAGQDREAIACFNKAIKIDPNMATAYYGLGVSLMHTREYLPAIRQLKHALALNPSMSEAQARIEEAYRLAGRHS